MGNKIGTNRPSPPSEPKYVNVYKGLVKPVKGMDISAVRTLDGTPGYGQLPQSINRSRDDKNHRIKNFISSAELRKAMGK